MLLHSESNTSIRSNVLFTTFIHFYISIGAYFAKKVTAGYYSYKVVKYRRSAFMKICNTISKVYSVPVDSIYFMYRTTTNCFSVTKLYYRVINEKYDFHKKNIKTIFIFPDIHPAIIYHRFKKYIVYWRRVSARNRWNHQKKSCEYRTFLKFLQVCFIKITTYI